MPDSSASTAPYDLQFIEKHVPALEDGEYKLSINQTVTIKGVQMEDYSYKSLFWVYGPRFSLSDDNIYEVFPPNNSTGEHSNVMPHIMLCRSTLPWERQVNEEERKLPWLALLVFYEEEVVTSSNISVQDLIASLPYITKESFQKDTDKLTVIDVDEDLLRKVMPDISEIPYLAHVRAIDPQEEIELKEYAVVVANRLPKKNGKSIAYLVSLENCFDSTGFDYGKTIFNGKIRLVTLTSFQFSCFTKDQSFKGLLCNLNTDQNGVQSSICNLRLDAKTDSNVEKYLDMGYVPMYHNLRSGKKTASWYHSPLAPNKQLILDQLPIPAKSSDDLLIFDNNNGMFDTTYAAAWQLGRLLGLASDNFASSMYSWKRQQEQQKKMIDQDKKLLIGKDFFTNKRLDNKVAIPPIIESWFKKMRLLSGVPFKYLVPDKSMLEEETIRFFVLDKLWLSALYDGAFSLGRVATKEYDSEHKLQKILNQDNETTGILLHSEVVSGWPGLQVDAISENSEKLKILMMKRLSTDLLLCLFQGTLTQIEIFKKPESLHFGVDDDDNSQKELRNPTTNSNLKCPYITVPFRNYDDRVIDITSLVGNILQNSNSSTTITSAGFAYEMIEGAERVKFKTKGAE